MKKSLLSAALFCGFLALFAAPQKSADSVSLDKSGCIRAGGLRFSGDTYYKRVNHTQHGKSWKVDSASEDKVSGISVNKGKIIISEMPEISYAASLAKSIDGSFIYTLHVSGTSRNFTVRTSLAEAEFAGRELNIDGRKVLLPLEKAGKKVLVDH